MPSRRENSRHVIFSDGATGVQVWDTRTWQILGRFDSITASAGTSAITSDSGLLAVVGRGGRVDLWILQSHSKIGDLAKRIDADRDTAWVWEVSDGKPRAVLKSRNANGLGHVAFSPDDKTLITSGADGWVELWNIVSGRVVLTVRSLSNLATLVFFSPDENALVVAGRGQAPKRFVQILQTESLAELDAAIKKEWGRYCV